MFNAEQWASFSSLRGVALEVKLRNVPGKNLAGNGTAQTDGGAGKQSSGKARKRDAEQITFLEDLLFTHRGLSGPAILQISTFWNPGEPIEIDLSPDLDIAQALTEAKPGNRQQLSTVLAGLWPRRLAEQWLALEGEQDVRLADLSNRRLQALADRIHHWRLVPTGTAGYRKAEVMRGGVDTNELDQRSMQARKVEGLHFIGEAVDVTGWLGG